MRLEMKLGIDKKAMKRISRKEMLNLSVEMRPTQKS